jgi:hyaluronan synthase
MMAPRAWFIGRSKTLVVATVPLLILLCWGLYHVFAVMQLVTGRGNPLALTWLVAFMFLWWTVLAWFEKPATVTPRQAAQLDDLVVAASIPAYNEEPDLLRQCIQSLFDQTRFVDRIHVVDDGSHHPDGTPQEYAAVRAWFFERCAAMGIDGTWLRQENAGKRHAQMAVLADDDADVFLTLDSDSVLDTWAVEEGLKPFVDPNVHSVAGMVVVWNSRANWLARLTCMLYTPFTRGFRSAQSVLGSVLVNSGTLAFYRGPTIRKYAGSYEHETFLGRPMQMNDDSMMTFYALMEPHGRAVHQCSSVAFTIVPETFGNYVRQQIRWMRGTTVRTLWWTRYFSPLSIKFWMPLMEVAAFLTSLLVLAALAFNHELIPHPGEFWATTALVGVLINYVISLRYFVIQRSDEQLPLALWTFALAPFAGVWRMIVLRPMMLYAYLTFWKVGSWGTRMKIEDAGSALRQ